jgi:hypothetical protein
MKRTYLWVIAALVVGVLGTLVFVAVMNGFPGFTGPTEDSLSAATIPAGASTVTVQALKRTGITLTMTAVDADGNYCVNDGRTYLQITNAGATTPTVTVQTPLTVGGVPVADLVITVSQYSTMVAGPFNKLWFNELSGANRGKMSWTYSSPNSLTVGAVSWTP